VLNRITNKTDAIGHLVHLSELIAAQLSDDKDSIVLYTLLAQV